MRHPTHWSKDDGTTAIEFALVFPVLAAIVLFTIYGGLYVYYAAVAEHVARVAVRYASIPTAGNATYPADSAVSTTAGNTGNSLIPNPTTVTVTSTPLTSTPAEGDEVTVSVTYDLPAVAALASALWFIPSPPTSVSRTASARRE